MRKLTIFIMLCIVSLWTGPVFAQQGQWGGFIYLIPKEGVTLSPDRKDAIAKSLQQEAGDFHADFNPEKGKMETIQFLKTVEYSQDGKPLSSRVPSGLILVESMKRAKIDNYHKAVSAALKDYFDVEYRVSVTRELKYTDTGTLDQLKASAPKRGSGKDQPNGVVLPLTKTAAWWTLPLDKRKQYFDSHPDTFGKTHLGHNGVGFMYIKSIFRKLYHSRFADDQQDFMTYFEFPDSDVGTFNALLDGLRDKQKNPEWGFVQEGPLFQGKREMSLAAIL